GGQITVSDAPGGGASFTIALPASQDSSQESEGSRDGAGPTGLAILIVEDDREIGEMLREILCPHGHRADLATDSREGLRRAISNDYDLVLSDMRMPHIDGPRFYEKLKNDYPSKARRIGFITGDTLSAEFQSFLSSSGVLYLEKPFDPNDVLTLV